MTTDTDTSQRISADTLHSQRLNSLEKRSDAHTDVGGSLRCDVAGTWVWSHGGPLVGTEGAALVVEPATAGWTAR